MLESLCMCADSPEPSLHYNAIQYKYYVKGLNTKTLFKVPTDSQAQGSMPPKIFQSWGHKNVLIHDGSPI